MLDFGLANAFVRLDHEYYRLITSGFLHAGVLHLAFNMFALWQIGNMLEPALGRLRFGLLYAGGLLGGSLGVMVAGNLGLTVGASGAIFGLFAGAFIAQRAVGIDVWRSGIGPTIAINMLITFSLANVSRGGHIGGLAAGALFAWILIELPRRTRLPNRNVPTVIRAVLLPVVFVAAIAAAYAFDPLRDVVGA